MKKMRRAVNDDPSLICRLKLGDTIGLEAWMKCILFRGWHFNVYDVIMLLSSQHL